MLVQQAESSFEAFVGTAQTDPAYQARLNTASAALSALRNGVDAIDDDFASPEPLLSVTD